MATYAAYQFTAQDGEGNVVAGAKVEIRSEIDNSLVTLYGARDGSGTPPGNPATTDSNGFVRVYVAVGRYRVRIYTGSSGAPTSEQILEDVDIGQLGSKTQRTVKTAGDVTVSFDDDDIIIINKTVGAATTVNLPSAALRTRPVTIVDGKGDAATNNITLVPVSGQSVYATVDYTPVVDGNGGSLTLTPKEDGTGWF